jgi:CRP-like cAMP-binding protein
LEANKLEVLSAMDILRDLPESDIEALMSRTPMRTARIGTTFFGAADGPEVLFLLKSGRVELYCFSPEGKKLTLAIVEYGTILGEMSLIGQRIAGTFPSALKTGRKRIEITDHAQFEQLVSRSLGSLS